jgi:3-oxoadipate enol-lactonase
MMNLERSEFFVVKDTQLYYEVKGKGESLLLIHGLPIDSGMWDDQFDELSNYFKVIRFDLAGYGKSGVHDEDYSLIEDIKSLLDYLNIKRTSIIGFSVGGQISLDFSVQYPEMVESLILASTGLNGWSTFSREREEFNQELNSYYQNYEKEKAINLMTKGWVAGPFRTLENINEEVRDQFSKMVNNTFSKQRGKGSLQASTIKVMDNLDKIHFPTLLITSEFDFPEFNEIASFFNSKIKGSKIVMISGTAHMLNMERPNEFNEAVINFLFKRDE